MKRALVTGGTKGIGLGIVKMLLKEGYYVTATYAHDINTALNCEAELQEYKDYVEFIKINQSSRDDIYKLTNHLLKKETINCIICNAGTTIRKDFKDITDDEWTYIINTNLNSNVYLIRDLYPIIEKDSRILFIGSMMGIYPHGTSIGYGVTKSALHSFAINLVKYFEGTGTTINVIAPGFVETEWQKNKPLAIRSNIYNKTAIKRFASIEEIVSAVHFCLNNAFVNSTIIEINGGYCFK